MTTTPTGYRKKPAFVYLAAVCFMLAPLGNLLLTLYWLHIPRWWSPVIWKQWTAALQPEHWILMTLIFVTGVSLLVVRKGTWILALTTLSIMTLYNLLRIQTLRVMGIFVVIAMILATLTTLIFFIRSQMRLPYLNERLRWWETSPRFRITLNVALEGISDQASLADVSMSGALVEWSGADIENKTTVMKLPNGLELACEVARRTAHGIGLRFVQMNFTKKRALRAWLNELKKGSAAAFR